MNTFPPVRVRFHLAKGQHYMHWQLRQKDCPPAYYDPNETTLVMKNATLKNRRRTAEKIFNKESGKTVCAWIEVDSRDLTIIQTYEDLFSIREIAESIRKDETPSFVSYNPKIAPYWTDDDDNNVDNQVIPFLYTFDRCIFVLP